MYTEMAGTRARVKMWTQGVEIEHEALQQIRNLADLPITHGVGLMPDAHVGKGCTVGTVLVTIAAVPPACVGVDLSCGMMAIKTTLRADDWRRHRQAIHDQIDHTIPTGGPGIKGSWQSSEFQGAPWHAIVDRAWDAHLATGWRILHQRHPWLMAGRDPRLHPVSQLGTLGTGNHFIEVCADENDDVWVMLHSGSRGMGVVIANHFIAEAQAEMNRQGIKLVDRDLAWLVEGTSVFDEYVEALAWAGEYAMHSRRIMMNLTLQALEVVTGQPVIATERAVNCHHNYVSREQVGLHELWVTRKGAVSARAGELGIIPGSMGARSYIVRGKGSDESFNSCSHGAGRRMSRGKAKQLITLQEHQRNQEGIACRADASTLDEAKDAYKNIEAVMAAQDDLVEVVHELRQFVVVKG